MARLIDVIRGSINTAISGTGGRMKTTQTDLDRRKFLKLSTRYATYAAASPIIIACSGGGGGSSAPDSDPYGSAGWTLVPTASSDAAAAAEAEGLSLIHI